MMRRKNTFHVVRVPHFQLRTGSGSSTEKPHTIGLVCIILLALTAFIAVTWPVTVIASPFDDRFLIDDRSLIEDQEVGVPGEKECASSASAIDCKPLLDSPSNVYVITEDDIRSSGATDIPTLLRQVPGMEVIQMTGAQFDVSVRGGNQAGSSRLLIRIDGRSIYLDTSGAGLLVWKSIPVTLPEIKRIEVLKGPASSVYGFNAFDGVVNIITKSPEEMTEQGKDHGSLV